MVIDRATGTVVRISPDHFDAAAVDAAIAEMEKTLGVPAAAIAQRAMLRVGDLLSITGEQPIIKTGKADNPEQSTTHHEKNWQAPRLSFAKPRPRDHVDESEMDGPMWETRGWRFEVSRLVPRRIREKLGDAAIFLEFGAVNSRPTDLAKRIVRMHTREDAKAKRRLAAEAAAAEREALEYHRTYGRRDAAKARLEAAEADLQEALARARATGSYADEQAAAKARQTRDKARIGLERESDKAELERALAWFDEQIETHNREEKRGRRLEAAHRRALTSVKQRPTSTFEVYRQFNLY